MKNLSSKKISSRNNEYGNINVYYIRKKRVKNVFSASYKYRTDPLKEWPCGVIKLFRYERLYN